MIKFACIYCEKTGGLMSKPKIFVGTMYCGEGDYDKCCQSIDNQKNVSVIHSRINNMPEKQAHNLLWDSWRQVKDNEFDMFVKVDADTVLAHDEVLSELWKLMSSNPRITGIQAPLLDYFTDNYINGLNCFSPKVTFKDSTDELFCDRRVDVDHDIVICSNDVPQQLRPAGYHCYHPTDVQSFHFGLHRALKCQIQVIDLVKQAWKRHGDKRRALALLGASCANTFNSGGFNYDDERFKLAFDGVINKYEQLVINL